MCIGAIFGPTVGRELSSRRYALVLSNADLHDVGRVAIVVPTSGKEPCRKHRAWHRRVADAENWASIRQAKAIPLRILDPASPMGFASSEELRDIRQRMGLVLVGCSQSDQVDLRRGRGGPTSRQLADHRPRPRRWQ